MPSYLTGFVENRKVTPQSKAIPGSNQVANNQGGYSFEVDKWTRLRRFLILGSEGGSYYASERKLTEQNLDSVKACIQEDGIEVVKITTAISLEGRAPKNDPAILVLAMCASSKNENTRRYALANLNNVCRIGTHLFSFVQFKDALSGYGRATRTALSGWYLDKEVTDLAYQLVKYPQRDGWSHRDIIRLAHPSTKDPLQNDLIYYATKGWKEIGKDPPTKPGLDLLWAVEKIKRSKDQREVCQTIIDYRVPWEAVPTEWLAKTDVWDALLANLPLTATIRNLGRLTANGLLTPMSRTVDMVCKRITDQEKLTKARIHPVNVLIALLTYSSGKGIKGGLAWTPIQKIVNSLDEAFYKSFGNVTPTGKRTMISLDISGSMTWSNLLGIPGLTPRVASTAISLVTAATEPNHMITAFSTGLIDAPISPRQRLDDALNLINRMPFGGTDCALPMLHATNNKIEVDTFIIFTDSETGGRSMHPCQALNQYRQKMGIPAKLVVSAMTANKFTVADPNDSGTMDVVGFDSATPQMISDFSAGLI